MRGRRFGYRLDLWGTMTKRLPSVSGVRFSERQQLHLQEPGRPNRIAWTYAKASKIEAVVENRRCSAGWRKSLYGARRTVGGDIFKALSSKAWCSAVCMLF